MVRDTELKGNTNSFTITIQNNNSTPLSITRYALKVDTEFSIEDSSIHSLPADTSGEILIGFNPTVTGTAADTLVIYSNDGVTPRASVALVGLGTAGFFHLSVNPLNFGSVTIGGADTMSVNLKNIGNGELSVAVLGQTANPDFQLFTVGPQPTPPFVLEPGDTETATLIFSPSIEGPDTSLYALTVNPDAIDQFDTVLLLVGVGLPPSSVANNSTGTFNLSIVPNPVAEIATIRLTGAAGTNLIEISDALGRSVLRETLPSAGGTLDLRDLANGTYFVHATGANGSAAQQIMLER
ncbi:MAG TPA: choice-of-anchor D domain-containing protein [Candidatus Kapabacteria bacterium]|nr:choice-of-anchor D domain-containing protein [Candidatus Kapabacteria bacterium]